ncbi:MAG: hypothetical protein RJP95_03645, partial [Pirellulales bacterium]
LDPGWLQVVDHNAPQAIQRAYLERPRGHSKTGDIAAMSSWALYASRRGLKGIAAAADRDQAKLLRDAISGLVADNPWLADALDVQAYVVVNRHTGSRLEIISSDAPSSYGLTPDFILCDEITHWKNSDLWESLFSAAAKRKRCLLAIIANAGFGMGNSWQWTLREAARESSLWYFHSLDGPQASWISPELLAEQEALLPPPAYRRLWRNEWTTGFGDALDDEDIQAAHRPGMNPMTLPEEGYGYCIGLDLGVRRDHSAMVVLAGDYRQQRVRVALVRSWAPDPITRQVDLIEVRNEVYNASVTFGNAPVLYDPHQCHLLAQQLAQAGIPTHEVPFVGKNLNGMATTLLQVFRERNIDMYDDPTLVADLRRLVIEEKNYGVRLTAQRDKVQGHADRATALAIALPSAMHGAMTYVDPRQVEANIRWLQLQDRMHYDSLGKGW